MKEQEKIYQAYANAIFNLNNWINIIERGNKLTRKQEIEKLKAALSPFYDAQKMFAKYINKNK